MFVVKWFALLLVLCQMHDWCYCGKKIPDLIQRTTDLKEFKKILRTRTNVLVAYTKSGDKSLPGAQATLLKQVANDMTGLACIVVVDCSSGKKLCKKYKASPSPVLLKHYKDGEFNKDYDRHMTHISMMKFLRDPKGDRPWEEESDASDVRHVDNRRQLTAVLNEKRPTLVMFYTPWCGFCKKLKPDYAEAATELKEDGKILVGMDVDTAENQAVRQEFNITGFPTIVYFEKGKKKYQYGGENNKDGIVKWMENPEPYKEKEPEKLWSDEESDVVHLTDETFSKHLESDPSVLVMFYAPWCGHCKKMKPEYDEAAKTMKEQGIKGTLAAVDVTQNKKTGEEFKIKGFPTVKHFKEGKPVYDFNERTAAKIVDFMKDPDNPPPPPPPEEQWSDTPSAVEHLTDDNFKSSLKRKKHALVMFYAPWCGHCKKAKPEFTGAAEKFKDDNKVMMAAIDCTKHTAACKEFDVTGYPTIKYFFYGKNAKDYAGGREEADFVRFMEDPSNPLGNAPPPPPNPKDAWKDVPGGNDIHVLSSTSFASFMKEHPSVLVMFYAPWCGHCTAMKPAYGQAAMQLKEEVNTVIYALYAAKSLKNVNGKLAAIDATVENELAKKFDVKGFPTLKYFKDGKMNMEYNEGRDKDHLVEFMKKQTGMEPAEEKAWKDLNNKVIHLDDNSFSAFVKEAQAALVLFYQPWCPHCKAVKPTWEEAAELVAGTQRGMAAVDCSVSLELCAQEGVMGYPHFKFYGKGESEEYEGDRTAKAYLSYLGVKTSEKEEL